MGFDYKSDTLPTAPLYMYKKHIFITLESIQSDFCIILPVVISSKCESSPFDFLSRLVPASNMAKLRQGWAKVNSDTELTWAVSFKLSWWI